MKGIGTAVLTVIATAALAAQAQGAARADLTVTRLSEPPAGAQPGSRLAVTDAVRNAGRAKAGKSTVVYWLSADRRKNAGDVRAGRRAQKPLKGRRTARGRATLTVPASLAAGVYHLVACADGTGKVRERNERNNCRASRSRVAVTALALPGAPALPGPTVTATPTPPDPTPTPPGDPAVPEFPLDPDPLTVTHTLDTARAVTQRIESFGGEIAVTAADGTKYTLTVPNKALVSRTDITLTPVVAVNGSPLSGGLVGAVEILPHGLELLAPATLTIEPAAGAGPVDGQTGFLSHEQGEDFHLYPLDMGAALKLHLTHFSTPGVAQASAADREVLLRHPPERARAQYEQEMAELMRKSRAAALVGENPDLPTDQIAALLAGYYKNIVAPLAEQAKTNDDLAPRAMGELIGWSRQIDLLSLMEHPAVSEYREGVWAISAVIIANAIQKGYTKCVDGHDLDYVVRLMSLARTAALLVLPMDLEALDKATRCANFELRFDSTIVESHGYVAQDGRTAQTDGRWRMKATVVIPSNGLVQGAVLDQTEFSYSQTLTYPCGDGTLRYDTTGSNPVDDTDGIVSLGIDLNLREPGTPPPADRDISMFLIDWGNEAKATYTQDAVTWCGDNEPPGYTEDRARWYELFVGFHDNHRFEDWTLGTPGGQVIATKRYDNPDTGDGVLETTILELWHKPLK